MIGLKTILNNLYPPQAQKISPLQSDLLHSITSNNNCVVQVNPFLN